MKRFLRLFIVFCTMFIGTAYAACTSDQIDVLGDGTQCETAKFTLTTTNTTSSFSFTLSPVGTFYVDCGAGGTLSGGTASGKTITRSNTTNTTYTCTYSDAGAYTIKFGGSATNTTSSYNEFASVGFNYYSNPPIAAISFYVDSSQTKIASISGNLSSMFPMTSAAANRAQPRFYQTFRGATGLTSIPNTLFADYTSASNHMFPFTFYGCTGLTSLPQNLFFLNATSVTGQAYMFYETFYGCTGLTSLPANLFGNVTTSADGMFDYTFYNCTGLTSIPENLFFPNATSVTGKNYMFQGTFYDCRGLTSLPADLFSKVTTAAQNMFADTFYGCRNMGGYIPPSTFKGLIDAGHPTTNGMFLDTFYNTQLVTECPSGTSQFITGYEGTGANGLKFGGKVSCIPATPMAITLDTTNADTAANPATVYLTYNTKWTSDSAGNNTISALTTLPTKTGYAFNGFWTGANGTGTQVVDKNGTFLTSPAALTFTSSATSVYADFRTSYTVTYSCGTGATGNAPATETVLAGEQFIVAANNTCAKTEHTFNGWNDGITDHSAGESFTWNYNENKTFTAQWTQCQACATTNASCSLSVVNNVCTYATSCNAGYGDIQNNGAYNASCSASYSITYTMDGGTNYSGAPATYTSGTGVTIDGMPTKSGYTFTGWTGSNGNTPQLTVTIGSSDTGDKSYTANWSQCTACATTNASCTFDGVVNNVCTYTTTCNTGYGNIQNNGAYNASCSQLLSYNITYTMDGGTNYNGAPATYTEGTGTTIDGMPTKSGYTFTGWTGSNGNTPQLTVTISTSDTGDKSYTANWSQCTACATTNASCSLSVVNNVCTYTTSCNTGYDNIQNNGAYNASCSAAYTVTYSCGDGTGTPPASGTATSGASFTPAANTCTRNGYFFNGWAVSGTNDVKPASIAFSYTYGTDKTFTATWIENGFSITTTNISSGGTFKFYISAAGNFTVSCGDGGVLSGTGVSGNVINRTNNTTGALYTCTYSTPGIKTVTFNGTATAYNSSYATGTYYYPSIYFSNVFYGLPKATPDLIESVSGSIGSVFPTLGNGASQSQLPVFTYTFYNCTNLTAISDNLFSGVTGGSSRQFQSLFNGNTSLTSIPSGLFSSVTRVADRMFAGTFNGCTNLSGYIPPTTFAGLIANGSPTATDMWSNTFNNTNVATSCEPYGLQQYITHYEGTGTTTWNGKVSCEPGGSAITACSVGGTHLRTSGGLRFPLYNEKTTSPALAFGFGNGQTCYIQLESGQGSSGTLNVGIPNVGIYHANSVSNQ